MSTGQETIKKQRYLPNAAETIPMTGSMSTPQAISIASISKVQIFNSKTKLNSDADTTEMYHRPLGAKQ